MTDEQRDRLGLPWRYAGGSLRNSRGEAVCGTDEQKAYIAALTQQDADTSATDEAVRRLVRAVQTIKDTLNPPDHFDKDEWKDRGKTWPVPGWMLVSTIAALNDPALARYRDGKD